MLQEGGRGGVLPLLELDDRVGDSIVRDVLKSKHPIGQPANPDALIPGQAPIPPDLILCSSKLLIEPPSDVPHYTRRECWPIGSERGHVAPYVHRLLRCI